MEDWAKRLLEVLVGMSTPIMVEDIMRIVEVPGNDRKVLYDAIAKINRTLPQSGYKLVIEDSPCLGCGSWNLFNGADYETCQKCGKDLVPPPKFCINPKEMDFY